jgi:hypothetical protein
MSSIIGSVLNILQFNDSRKFGDIYTRHYKLRDISSVLCLPQSRNNIKNSSMNDCTQSFTWYLSIIWLKWGSIIVNAWVCQRIVCKWVLRLNIIKTNIKQYKNGFYIVNNIKAVLDTDRCPPCDVIWNPSRTGCMFIYYISITSLWFFRTAQWNVRKILRG